MLVCMFGLGVGMVGWRSESLARSIGGHKRGFVHRSGPVTMSPCWHWDDLKLCCRMHWFKDAAQSDIIIFGKRGEGQRVGEAGGRIIHIVVGGMSGVKSVWRKM